MARRHDQLIAGLALAVLLVHWAALSWLQAVWQSRPQLKPLAKTFYTRVLEQSTPAPPPMAAAKPAPAPAAPRTLAAVSPRPPQATAPARAASAAEPAQTVERTVTAPPAPSVPAQTTATAPLPVAAAPAPTPDPAVAAAPAAAPPAPAASAAKGQDLWPADTRMSYRLTGYYRGDLTGDARVQWQRTGDSYQVRVEVDVGPLTLLTMTSQGKVTPQGLHPTAYEEILRNRRRSVTLESSEVVLEQNKRVPRPENVQDTASQFVELAHVFATGRTALTAGQFVQFPMARPAGVDAWIYDMVEETTLNTPRLGAVRAIHLKPRPIANPRGNIRAEMWYAPSLQYLPVRIRILVGDDSHVDLLVDKIEQR